MREGGGGVRDQSFRGFLFGPQMVGFSGSEPPAVFSPGDSAASIIDACLEGFAGPRWLFTSYQLSCV